MMEKSYSPIPLCVCFHGFQKRSHLREQSGGRNLHKKIGTTSIAFRHIIRKTNSVLMAKDRKICVTLDSKTGKKYEIPQELKNLA